METISTSSSSGQQHSRQQRDNKASNDETSVVESLGSSPTSALNIGLLTKTSNTTVVYDVEHLATFSTNNNQNTSGSHEADRTTASGGNDNNDDSAIRNSNSKAGIGKSSNDNATPKVALQRLFELEKLSGIWTQHMQIELRDDFMLIVDCETNSTVERFNRDCVTRPEAFNHYNDIYNNIVVFIIHQPCNDSNGSSTSDKNRRRNHKSDSEESDIASDNYQDNADLCEGELHIFQCVSHKAQQLVSDILNWKLQKFSDNQTMPTSSNSSRASSWKQGQKNSSARRTSSGGNNKNIESIKSSSTGQAQGSGKPAVTVASSTNNSENVPIINVNVKETVQVFNQIAALREKSSSKPSSPVNHSARPLSEASGSANSTPVGPTSVTNNDPNRSPLSPSSQLYKQRSIRATLAPKYASSGSPGVSEHPSPAHSTKIETQKPSSSNNSGSAASSSSVDSADAAKLAYQLAGPSRHLDQAGQARNEPHPASKQSAASLSSSGIHHHASSGQHKVSSKSKALHQSTKTQSSSSHSHASSSSQSHLDQVTTNESYVSVLNHCFDDIEKFIIRLQQAIAAMHELQAKRKLSKRSSQTKVEPTGGYAKGSGVSSPTMTASELAMLNSKARGPSEDDYFEILSKFKLAFNLLAKLKGCIHEPNAPELVHFLFTPLAIIIESARNATPPVDPTLVGVPYLNQEALDLLSNCCTSKESDMWISLGSNWTQTIDINLLKASRLPSSFQPIFSDGWAPIIGELELIGLVAPSSIGLLNASERTTPADVIDSNHHHHHQVGGRSGHDGRFGEAGVSSSGYQPYMLDEAGTSIANSYTMDNSSFSNGKVKPRGSAEAPSHAISNREYKSNVPLPPNNRHQPGPLKHTIPQRSYVGQINQVPYGYPLDDPNMMDPNVSEMRGIAHRLGPDRSRNIRFSATEGQVPRRIKQSSRYQDYPMPSNYDTSLYPMSSQPPLEDDSHLDADLLAHQNGNVPHHHHHDHPNDYSELQEHYMDDAHNPRVVSGPSHQHYRAENGHNRHNVRQKSTNSTIYNRPTVLPPFETNYMNEADHEAMLMDLGPAQTEWFFELQSRGSMIVRVLFTRDANNDKELSVRRGEILEVLDDTRKWWRARNINLQVAHVPHTIVAVMQGYQTLDELLANSPGNMDESSMINPQRFSRRNMPLDHNQHQWHDEKRNSKTAGAFRTN